MASLDPTDEVCLHHGAGRRVQQQERSISLCQRWVEDTALVADIPDDRDRTFHQGVNHLGRRGYIDVMEDADEFCHQPFGHLQHKHCIHVVRVNISTDVPDTPVVSHLVESDDHSRYLDADGPPQRDEPKIRPHPCIAVRCNNELRVAHHQGAASSGTAGLLLDSGPGERTSPTGPLAIAATRIRLAVVQGRTLRAKAHGEACPAFEHVGRRPEAVEHPINTGSVARGGHLLGP